MLPKKNDATARDLDHNSNPEFYAYYANESLSEATLARFRRTKDKMLMLAAQHGFPTLQLDVVDIGCGAGTQSRLWAEAGHRVHGLDVNEPLIDLARQRASDAGLSIQFDLGSATALPYPSDSMDICLLPELLEHVADWRTCLSEAVRVLRAGGLLFLSTTNVLCPRQEEFNLPLYSWYPRKLKRKVELWAITTKPWLANYAKYPAVHWFSYYSLKAYLSTCNVRCFDRFDMIDSKNLSSLGRFAIASVRAVAPLRLIGHVLTEGTVVFGMKTASR